MGIINNTSISPSDRIFISDNSELEDKLEKAIVAHFTKSNRILGGGKLHTSSITYCIREAVIKSWLFSTGKAKPDDFLDVYAGLNFQRGLNSEKFLTDLFGSEVVAQDNLEIDGVVGHPDCVSVKGDYLLELKNSNIYTSITLDSENILSYLYQTIIYMCMSNIETAHVIIIRNLPFNLEWLYSEKGKSVYAVENLKKKKEKPFKIVSVNLHKDSPLRGQILNALKLAAKHINEQDYTDENVIRNFPRLDDYSDNNLKCKYCAVKKHCDKIEPSPELDNELVKGLLNRIIKENLIKIRDEFDKKPESAS
jgi:hypothetical protein